MRAALLAASVLTAAPALAQEQSVDQRLDRLERLVEGLIARLDAEVDTTQQEQAEIRAQSADLLAATRDLQDRQTKLAAQVAVPQKQEDQGFRVGKTVVAYAGYVKLDAISQRTSGGQLPVGAFTREFLFPSAIPVGGEPSGFDTDFSSRQSRFIFTTATDVGDAHKLKSHIELDFIVTEGGNKRITNSFTPRLRQAFITYDNWLFGQAWSNFQNLKALPDTLDFIGITPGTVFNRQPQVRWSKNGLSVSLESPDTVITTRTGTMIEGDNDVAPDLVVRKDFVRPWGHVTTAVIARMLRVGDKSMIAGNDTALGYGMSVSGRINLGKRDNLRFMANAGDGIGRYIGLNLVNDAAVDNNSNLDPIFTISGYGAYQHFWSPRLRSSVAASYFKADNPVAFTTRLVTDESWNGLANLIWNPVDPLDIGIEVMYAQRQLEDGRSGNLQRVQFSTRYNF
jgi:hypothetical protein